MLKKIKTNDSNYSNSQLILAARLYYVDGVLQSQIAKMVGVSQTKVSRMLAVAREQGIVQITVPEYEPRNLELETELSQRFKLQQSIVVRHVAGQTLAERRHTLGYFAAPVVSRWVAEAKDIAIAGGRTLEALVENLSAAVESKSSPTILQAMGSVAATPGSYDASEIGRKLSHTYRGGHLTLNTPAFLPTKGTCEKLLGLKEICEVFDRLAKADLALVGIGTLENSVFVERQIFQDRDLKSIREAGAVGEILGRFYDSRGKECDTPLQHRVVSLPLDKLKRIRNVVAVVVGEDRCEALFAAIRAKLVKSVVIDELSAQHLLDLL